MQTQLHLDWESKSGTDLKVHGLDLYCQDPEAEILMGAYSFDEGPDIHWDANDGPIPAELKEALLDPHVIKWGFNSSFERFTTRKILKIPTPYEGWRCAMVLGHMQSFVGDLDLMGQRVGLPADKQKSARGKALIRIFSVPQKITKTNPHRWRTRETDPELWEEFCQYNLQDNVAERALVKRLIKYPIPEFEWYLYEIDQRINDVGLPIDMDFVENAIQMSDRRKAELTKLLAKRTGLANPNSPAQLTEWLKDRGYPFSDIRKDTVKKVLAEDEEARAEGKGSTLEVTARKALLLRQQTARTSVRKYTALKKAVTYKGNDYRTAVFRGGFQFDGAARTGRWAGRRLNPQNLTRTPKEIEEDAKFGEANGVPADYHLTNVTNYIRTGDYDALALYVKEPMDALAGTTRSAIRPPDGYELLTCDLSSIESCVIGWVSNCERLLTVFRTGKDAYKDFGTTLYSKDYGDITKEERTNSKPAVLGAGFRLGGGELKEGKRTGLWGYAESMGIDLSREESHKAVRLFREGYPEIPKLWYALEEAIMRSIRTGRPAVPIIKIGSKSFQVPVRIEMLKPYLTIVLPSGRRLYYHKPRIMKRTLQGKDGPYTKEGITYMGQPQGTKQWTRLDSHGGKFTENIVQAIARDILAVGMVRAYEAGFRICGHVHDELIALIRKGAKYLTKDLLKKLMTADMDAYPGLPLNAEAAAIAFYRK